jgi:hypothetical protein
MQGRFRRGALAAVAALALAGGAAVASAGAASAQTYSDTSLQASSPFTPNGITLGTPSTETTGATIGVTCDGGFISGQPLTVAPPSQGDVTATLSPPSTCNGTLTIGTSGTPVNGTYDFAVSASPSPSHNATDKAVVVVTVAGNAITQVETDSVLLFGIPNTVYPNISFSGTETCGNYANETVPGTVNAGQNSDPCGYSSTGVANGTAPWTPNITSVNPSGEPVSSGNELLAAGSDLAPGTYNYATVAGSDTLGAVSTDTFTLAVSASRVRPVGAEGDYVNPYGNGFDVYQQHYAANRLVAGWTATRDDPATHFIQETNVHGGYSLEAVNGKGIATGLCVSDPVGSEPAGFITGQLTLRGCNGSVFQGFTPNSTNGSLASDTGAGHVEPNGTGAPLVVTTVFDGWGGYKYVWKDLAQLP